MAINIISKKQGIERKLVVRLAENQYEIEQTLVLRYNVFNLEMGEGLPESRQAQKDRDEYDYFCEHLIVKDETNDRIVGTYRILNRSVAKENIGFYSENEFDLRKLYEFKDEVAEVGRSCVHPDYRDGSVISLLWSGFGEYMLQNNVRYLMGCGSIHSVDPIAASQAYAYLKENKALASDEFGVTPYPSHSLEGFDPNYLIEDKKAIIKSIPPIIKGYVRLGAKICGYPAVDRVFGTTDMFVLFDRKEIDARYGKHYLKE
ncbi:MAG: GNAT family N-acetyltransferase [Leptospiraceae bacterium]|nr:GNAT family N-acetyltransferase [Leptospiraceae bacterium]